MYSVGLDVDAFVSSLNVNLESIIWLFARNFFKICLSIIRYNQAS